MSQCTSSSRAGYLLDLIDDDLLSVTRRVGRRLLSQAFGTGDVTAGFFGVQQIDPDGIGIGGTQQRAVARLRGPQRKNDSDPGAGRLMLRLNMNCTPS
jgi:hypothetical protein